MDKNKMIIGVVVLVAVGVIIYMMQGGDVDVTTLTTDTECTDAGGHWVAEVAASCVAADGTTTVADMADEAACTDNAATNVWTDAVAGSCMEMVDWNRSQAADEATCTAIEGSAWNKEVAAGCAGSDGTAVAGMADEAACTANNADNVWTEAAAAYCGEAAADDAAANND